MGNAEISPRANALLNPSTCEKLFTFILLDFVFSIVGIVWISWPFIPAVQMDKVFSKIVLSFNKTDDWWTSLIGLFVIISTLFCFKKFLIDLTSFEFHPGRISDWASTIVIFIFSLNV